jgi:hypothetical protein
MPAIKVTVLIEKDGQPLQGYPYVRKVNTDELQVFDPYLKAIDPNNTTFTTLPLLAPVVSALLVRADQVVTLRLNGQASAGVVLNPGGLLLILDGVLNAGAATNATINNFSPAIANVRGFGAGT